MTPERIEQVLRELEQAPRMVEHIEERLAIHRDSCHVCLSMSRGYCSQYRQMRYRADRWFRVAYWAQCGKSEEEQA